MGRFASDISHQISPTEAVINTTTCNYIQSFCKNLVLTNCPI